MSALKEQTAHGYIRAVKHPDRNLWIYSTTRKAEDEGVWTPETKMAASGIVFGENGQVIAKGFPKIFPIPEGQTMPSSPLYAMKKYEGKLLISYPLDGEFLLAESLGFNTNASAQATQILQSNRSYDDLQSSMTYIFILTEIGELVLIASLSTNVFGDMSLADYNTHYTKADIYDRFMNYEDYQNFVKDRGMEYETPYILWFVTGERYLVPRNQQEPGESNDKTASEEGDG